MENKNLEEADVNEKQKVRNGKSAMPMRTCLVMILAGVYVAYLGVSHLILQSSKAWSRRIYREK